MLNRTVTVICLAILIIQSLTVIANIIFKKRADRIIFIRGFKKGKCAIIYLIAIPLYWIGHIYSGQNVINAFFGAVHRIINLVVLKYEVNTIEALMKADALYSFTIYFCFVLVGINAVLFTISLTNQYIWCALQAFKSFVSPKNQLYIFGNNPESVAIYNSDTARCKFIVDKITDQTGEELYLKKVSYLFSHSAESTVNRIIKLATVFTSREYVLVINTGNDDENLSVCRCIVNKIDSLPEEDREKLFLRFKAFVFGDPRYEAIYSDVVSSAYGCVQYVNKYQKIAMDFIDKYPLTKFMDETQVDYETSLIKEDVNVNVMLIGFGKTNQQVFLTSVANNQLLTMQDGEPKLKKIDYYIYDKEEAENNKNLNHSYYRYKHECSTVDPTEYLPLPELPAKEHYEHLDINSTTFYDTIRKIVTRSKCDANFIVIAFGSDLENIDMAQKLVEKRKEWGIENLVIFVKVRTWHKNETLLEDSGCYFIGNENDVVYNIDNIVGDSIFRMAQMRNAVYDLEYDITSGTDIVVDEEYVEQNNKNAYRKWYVSKSQLERESSLYACLSLRSKLNLMNLDYCRADENGDRALTEEEYLSIYAGDDLPDTSRYDVKADGKPIVSYTLDFAKSRRRNMAIHEHQRWNSFMISKGMIPSTKKQILEETRTVDGKVKFTNGKNYSVRRHGNLTSFDGLIEFRQMVAQRDKKSEESKDVIKYDYQLLDDAYWLLTRNGYKIIEHKKLY